MNPLKYFLFSATLMSAGVRAQQEDFHYRVVQDNRERLEDDDSSVPNPLIRRTKRSLAHTYSSFEYPPEISGDQNDLAVSGKDN